MKKKVLALSLALLIGVGAISGCSTTTIPNNPQLITQNPNQIPVSVVSSGTDSIKSELAEALEDEAIFADSETLLSEDGFSLKMLGSELNDAKASNSLKNAKVSQKRKELNKEKLGELKEKRNLRKEEAKQNAKKMKVQLEASGAIKVNEDGTITVDPKKVKDNLAANKEKIKARIEKNKEKLKELKAVGKEKFEKLRRKNNVVRNSDVVTTENADGSVTRTMTVEFKNEKSGITRKNVVSETKKEGKLVSVDHLLEMSGKGFTKKVTRLVSVNADGSKNVKIEAVTTWEDGRKRERVEERVVNSDKSFIGTGTLTITDKEGKTKTINLNSNGTAGGEVSTSAVDPETNTEVKIEEAAQGDVTLIVTEEGKEEVTEEIQTEEI